jgi:hypothetical protein
MEPFSLCYVPFDTSGMWLETFSSSYKVCRVLESLSTSDPVCGSSTN